MYSIGIEAMELANRQIVVIHNERGWYDLVLITMSSRWREIVSNFEVIDAKFIQLNKLVLGKGHVPIALCITVIITMCCINPEYKYTQRDRNHEIAHQKYRWSEFVVWGTQMIFFWNNIICANIEMKFNRIYALWFCWHLYQSRRRNNQTCV